MRHAPNRERAGQFLRFGIVGTVGFVVDASLLYALLTWSDAGFYLGRVVSYLAAATSTWYLNRQFTFRTRAAARAVRQWARFLAVNTAGGTVNYGIYSVVVLQWPQAAWAPLAGVAVGSLAGLVVNFTLSRRIVFRSGTPRA